MKTTSSNGEQEPEGGIILTDRHFILRGPPDTPYEGGEYWGQLLFPSDYPFKPPGIKVQTPSGRFQPDTKICTVCTPWLLPQASSNASSP